MYKDHDQSFSYNPTSSKDNIMLKNEQVDNIRLNSVFTFSANVKHNFSEESINIPQQTLISVSAFKSNDHQKSSAQILLLTTKKINQIDIKQIKKIKVYKKAKRQSFHTIKLQTQFMQKLWQISNKDCYQFSYTFVWMKLFTMGIHSDLEQDFVNICEGHVYKRSQILKNWEKRYLMITINEGLLSFKNKEDLPTLHIQSILDFWTRFQLIQDRKYLVFKLWHTIFKFQFAVPINMAIKWYKAFYSLLYR